LEDGHKPRRPGVPAPRLREAQPDQLRWLYAHKVAVSSAPIRRADGEQIGALPWQNGSVAALETANKAAAQSPL